MKAKMALAAFLNLLCFAAASLAQGTIVLYDPLVKSPEVEISPADEALVKEKLVPKARSHWNEGDSCDGSDLNIVGAVDGSFTKTGSKQRVIVYELCQTGNGFANNGFAVIENGKVVIHIAEAGGWNLEVAKVADLNRNGRDEIVIETGGGMHQGYYGTSITIWEFSAPDVIEHGVYLASTNECENHASNKYCDRSYKITARPGIDPAFFTQKYVNRGTDEKPRWVASGKVVAAKPIVKDKYTVVKYTVVK